MDFIARLTADHRMIGWLIVVALSIPPTFGYLGYHIAEPIAESWVQPEVVEELKEVERTFRFNAPLVLVLDGDNLFTRARNAAMHEAVAAIRDLPGIKQVVWMGDVPEVTLRGRRVRQLLPEDPETDEELIAARKSLTEHPLSSGSLVSDDGTTALLLIDTEDRERIRQVRHTAHERLDPVGIRTRATGVLALYEVHDRALEEDHIRIQGLAYALVTLLAIVIFRRPVAIFIAGAGPTTGVIWTLGWLRLIGQAENELAKIILPVMVIMIGFTDGMHMVVRLRQHRADGLSRRDAVYNAVRRIGPACFLTSVTTAIGFGSLMLSKSEMVSGFGRVSAIGVGLTFVSVVLITPLLANSWLGRRMHTSTQQDMIAVLISRWSGLVNFSTRHAKFLIVLGVLITGGCLYASLQLVPDDRLSDRVPHNSEEWLAMRDCDRLMGGIRYLRFVVKWDEGKTRNDIWPVVKQCQEVLAQEPLIGRSTSIRSCLTVFRGPQIEDRSILVNQLPDELKNQFYRPDLRTTQIVARQQDRGIATYEPVFHRLTMQAAELQKNNPGFQVELVSDVMIEGRVVRDMIVELMKSLAMASLIIFTTLAFAFGSLRTGLISILPNIMPLACSGALRLMISESLGIASACSFAICLGIAVDDTIHYLMHFQHERKQGRSPKEANHKTFVTVGSALLMTTVVMTVGLGTVMTSQMPPHTNFSAMGCTTLAAALIADLLFLPALLAQFPGREFPENQADGDGSLAEKDANL